MGRLLADIDISRSVPLASFLELEAAVRSGMFRQAPFMLIITCLIVGRNLFRKHLHSQYPVPHSGDCDCL